VKLKNETLTSCTRVQECFDCVNTVVLLLLMLVVLLLLGALDVHITAYSARVQCGESSVVTSFHSIGNNMHAKTRVQHKAAATHVLCIQSCAHHIVILHVGE
jgi:hypothetical protein